MGLKINIQATHKSDTVIGIAVMGGIIPVKKIDEMKINVTGIPCQGDGLNHLGIHGGISMDFFFHRVVRVRELNTGSDTTA